MQDFSHEKEPPDKHDSEAIGILETYGKDVQTFHPLTVS